MKTYSTCTNIAQLISVGTYSYPFGFLNVFSREIDSLRSAGKIFTEDFNYEKFNKILGEEAIYILNKYKPLEQFGISKYHSGNIVYKYDYNCRDTYLEFSFDADDDFIEKSCKLLFENDNVFDEVDKFLKMFCYGQILMSCDANGLMDHLKNLKGCSDCLSEYGQSRYIGLLLSVLHHMANKRLIGNKKEDTPYKLTQLLYDRICKKYSFEQFHDVFARNELISLAKENGEEVIDFDAVFRDINDIVKKYINSGVCEEGKEKALEWKSLAFGKVADKRDEQDEALIKGKDDNFKDLKKFVKGWQYFYESLSEIPW